MIIDCVNTISDVTFIDEGHDQYALVWTKSSEKDHYRKDLSEYCLYTIFVDINDDVLICDIAEVETFKNHHHPDYDNKLELAIEVKEMMENMTPIEFKEFNRSTKTTNKFQL